MAMATHEATPIATQRFLHIEGEFTAMRRNFKGGPYDGYDPDDVCKQTEGYIEFMQAQINDGDKLVEAIEAYQKQLRIEIATLS